MAARSHRSDPVVEALLYSPRIVQQSIERYEARAGHKLMDLPVEKCLDWEEHLTQKLAQVNGDVAQCQANLRDEERLFIRNERVMSMLSFRYWCRYATIQKDGGGIMRFTHPWESTKILLRFISKIEEEMQDAIARGEMTATSDASSTKPAVPGILIAMNKARQMAATTAGRLITMHRITTQSQRRALASSVDEDKIQEMYDRDKLIFDNLPWYLKPELLYDEKRAHIHLNKLNSRVLYQVSSQKSGIGVGRQIDIHHLTELSTWTNPQAVELDFFPAIPRSIHTFGLEESTPYGRGNWWHEWTEKVRLGYSERWRYLYVPWYAELSKYRALPPENWKPNETSLLHAQKVHDTSPAIVGHTVMLPRENLFWWETTREEYRRGNKLNFFLTNFSATPEESFQHSTQSAFDPEFLELLRNRTKPGDAYELVGVNPA